MSPDRDGPVTSTTLVGGPAGQRSAWWRSTSPVGGHDVGRRQRRTRATRGSRLTNRPVAVACRPRSLPVAAMPAVASTTPDHGRGRRLEPTARPFQPRLLVRRCRLGRVIDVASRRADRARRRGRGRGRRWLQRWRRRRPRGSVRWTWPPRASNAAAQRSASGAVGDVQAGTRPAGRPRQRSGRRAGRGAPGPRRSAAGPGSPPWSVTAAVTAPPGPGPGPGPTRQPSPVAGRRATPRATRPAADVTAKPARVLQTHDHALNPAAPHPTSVQGRVAPAQLRAAGRAAGCAPGRPPSTRRTASTPRPARGPPWSSGCSSGVSTAPIGPA